MKGFTNHEKLEEILAGPKGLAAFDFDNTLVHGDHGENCMYYLAFQGMIAANQDWFWEHISHSAVDTRKIDKLKNDLEELDVYEDQLRLVEWVDDLIDIYQIIYNDAGIEEAYRWTKALFAGLSEKELRDISRYVFEDQLRQAVTTLALPSGREIPTGLRIVSEMKNLIVKLVEKGWNVCIVTASPESLIQEVIKEWNLEEKKVRGMRLRSDNGILLPDVIEPMTYGRGKVEALYELIDENGDETLPFRLAGGDSFTDLELMLEAENAILVDRGKEDLREIARENSFLIEPFKPDSTDANDPYRPLVT